MPRIMTHFCKFWDPLCICGTGEASYFKSGVQNNKY